MINQIRIADLAVQQANRLPDLVRDAFCYQKIPLPVVLVHLLAQRAHEQPDQPRLHGVLLNVDLHQLRAPTALLQDRLEGRVGFGGDKGTDLVLGPHAAEDGDDGAVAFEKGCGVGDLGSSVLGEGSAVQVREVEGEVGLEKTWRREEGLALMELHVAPVAEIGAGDFGFAVIERAWSVKLRA